MSERGFLRYWTSRAARNSPRSKFGWFSSLPKHIWSLPIVVLSCFTAQWAGAQDWPGENGVLTLKTEWAVGLNEAIQTLDGVKSAVQTDDGSLYVASNGVATVMKYDESGRQVKRFGRWGEGPFEYSSPTILRMVGDQLVVYDSRPLKFIVFNQEGEGVRQWQGPTKSVSAFELRDNVLVAVTQGSHKNYLMRLDITTNDTLLFAPGSVQRNGLNVYEGTGLMGMRADNVYYMYPDEAVIREYNTRTRTEQKHAFDDPDWESDTSILPDTFEDMNDALFDGRLLNYFLTKSIALGALVLDDYTIALVEDGFVAATDIVVPKGKHRVLKLHVFDKQMRWLDAITLDIAARDEIGLAPVGVYKNSLLFIGAGSDEKGANLEWTYRRLKLERM